MLACRSVITCKLNVFMVYVVENSFEIEFMVFRWLRMLK